MLRRCAPLGICVESSLRILSDEQTRLSREGGEEMNVTVTKQVSVMVENRRGALAEVCTKLAEKAVNIQGMMVREQSGVARVRFVLNTLEVARKVFDGMGLKYTEEDVLSARLSDKPGALGKLTRKLADHGIDILYAYGTILRGAGKATVILAVSDLDAAAKLAK